MPDFDVAGDPALRALLRAARAWGVPPSIFLGRKQVTTHEYLNGQMVRSTAEPLWLEDDRAAAMALELYEADLCSGCGQPLSESTKIENEEKYKIAWEYCHGCVELDIYQDTLSKKAHASALLTSVSLPEEKLPDASDLPTGER